MLTKVEHELERTTPEKQGIASAAVLQFVEALESQINETHSFMLLRHGSVVAEGWWSPYGPEYQHSLFSLSKSFTSTAVGLALAEGHFSLDDTVLSFFPDETPEEVSDFLAAMRVRHLLSMSTGQASDTWTYMVDRLDGNWIKGFMSVPVVHEPGTQFLYNTGATYMLSAIVQKTTGMKVVDFLETRLFKPLGIENARWQESPQGITAGGIGLSLKTEDVARFGQLYLQKGMWNGKQILSESWVSEATGKCMSNSDHPQPDWSQGYGYQFWRCRHGAYRGDGVFGQYCIVMPEQDAVLVMTSGMDVFDMQQPLNLVWDILLPAMSGEALPEDPETQALLSEKLSSLNRTPAQVQAVSPIVAKISGRAYKVDENELNIERITLNFTDAGCAVTFKTAIGDETIVCGYGSWGERVETTIFKQAVLFDSTPATASGAWTAQDTFTMVVRLYETPFLHTLSWVFDGDELMLEMQLNVSLESLKPVLLTAKLV